MSTIGNVRRARRSVLTCVATATLLTGAAGAPSAQPGPPPPPPPSFAPTRPADVVIPSGFGGNPIDYFDDYSWRAFIALVWPVKPGQRGVPDTAAGLDGPGPRVFESYRSNWDTFLANGAAPPAWDAPVGGAQCPGAGPNDLVLASFSKFDELGQAGFGRLVGPLVAQNKTYVRYATGYDRIQYEQIVSKQLYLRAKLPGPPSPNGAITVKSAWIELAGVPNPETYYSRMAWVRIPGGDANCVQRQVGLVGLHIVQKTPSRPQWIWTTFEHQATAPDVGAATGGSWTFNDGSGAPMLKVNPNTLDQLVPTPPPNQVQRLKPVHAKTATTNTAWRAALKTRGSIWANYQLVMTQWPTRGPSADGQPANTFPGAPPNNATAFANTTMETYDQRTIFTGCMACHDDARADSDFVWSVSTHAFPLPKATPAPTASAARVRARAAPATRPLDRLKARLEAGAQ